MSKFEWTTAAICVVLVALTILFQSQWASERTKRVELEAEIAEHICRVDTVFIGLGDNKIQFSPIDSSGVTE